MMLAEKVSPVNSGHLNELFLRYYQSAAKSPVTSSYWFKYSSLTSVEKSNDRFLVNGCGFGHFVRPRSLRHVKHFLSSVLSRQLFSRFGVSQKIKAIGYEVARRQDRLLLFDEVKQTIICDLLDKHDVLKQSKVITVIGDGYGFMACLLRLAAPQAKIVCVNLGKILLFDMLYASKAFPDTKMILLDKNDDFNKALDQHSMMFVEAEKYEMLSARPIDLFINIESMQEMHPDMIKAYFNIIRSSTGKRYFYSCNREEKILPDGAVVRFDDYPWDAKKDEIIFDEICAINAKCPISVPPFWVSFDGLHKHRLTKMDGR